MFLPEEDTMSILDTSCY